MCYIWQQPHSMTSFACVRQREEDDSFWRTFPQRHGAQMSHWTDVQWWESSRRLLEWREKNGSGHWLLTTECAASVLYEVNSSIAGRGVGTKCGRNLNRLVSLLLLKSPLRRLDKIEREKIRLSERAQQGRRDIWLLNAGAQWHVQYTHKNTPLRAYSLTM